MNKNLDPGIYEVSDWELRIHDIFVEAYTADEEKRWELFAEFQMLVAEYQPFVYTITQNLLYVHKSNIHLANPEPSPMAEVLWRIQEIRKE